MRRRGRPALAVTAFQRTQALIDPRETVVYPSLEVRQAPLHAVDPSPEPLLHADELPIDCLTEVDQGVQDFARRRFVHGGRIALLRCGNVSALWMG